MVRSCNVIVPNNELGNVMTVLQNSPDTHGLATFYGEGVAMVTFKSDERKLQKTLNRLSNVGVGVRFGTVDVTALVTCIPNIRRPSSHAISSQNRKYRVDDRMTVEEIKDAIDAQSRLTFDFLAMTAIAAVMSGSGLVGDSGTTVVASMLVSPLMGPLLCVIFGLASRDRDMVRRGIYNSTAGVILCFSIGVLVGVFTCPYYADVDGIPSKWSEFIANGDLAVSSEMIERGTPGGLVMGFAIAVPSGFGVTLAVTTAGGINALVGVAISAALVPPIVNAGICVITGLYFVVIGGKPDVGMNFITLGLVSVALFALNNITMVLMGLLMMKIKKVTTIGATNKSWDMDMFYDDNRSSFFRSGVEVSESFLR